MSSRRNVCNCWQFRRHPWAQALTHSSKCCHVRQRWQQRFSFVVAWHQTYLHGLNSLNVRVVFMDCSVCLTPTVFGKKKACIAFGIRVIRSAVTVLWNKPNVLTMPGFSPAKWWCFACRYILRWTGGLLFFIGSKYPTTILSRFETIFITAQVLKPCTIHAGRLYRITKTRSSSFSQN